MYRMAFYNMKRRTLAGDRITMIVAESDNLQNHVNFAKELVERTNRTFENQVFPEIDRRITLAILVPS